MVISFGSDDTPTCTECKNRMDLTRRTPHAVLGHDFERQTFTCRVCHHEVERDADRSFQPEKLIRGEQNGTGVPHVKGLTYARALRDASMYVYSVFMCWLIFNELFMLAGIEVAMISRE
jgi:hypothetical protein